MYLEGMWYEEISILNKLNNVTKVGLHLKVETTLMHRVAVGDVTTPKRPENRRVLEDESARAHHHRQVRVAVVFCEFVDGHGGQ